MATRPTSIVDKNGKKTTVHKKVDDSQTQKARPVPPPKQPKVADEKELRRYDRQVTWASEQVFNARRELIEAGYPELAELLNLVGHEYLSAASSMQNIIDNQKKLINLLQEGRLADYSKFFSRYGDFLLGIKFKEFRDFDGNTYFELPEGIALSKADANQIDLENLRQVVAEYASLLHTVERYRERQNKTAPPKK